MQSACLPTTSTAGIKGVNVSRISVTFSGRVISIDERHTKIDAGSCRADLAWCLGLLLLPSSAKRPLESQASRFQRVIVDAKGGCSVSSRAGPDVGPRAENTAGVCIMPTDVHKLAYRYQAWISTHGSARTGLLSARAEQTVNRVSCDRTGPMQVFFVHRQPRTGEGLPVLFCHHMAVPTWAEHLGSLTTHFADQR